MAKAICGTCGKKYQRVGQKYEAHVRSCKGGKKVRKAVPPPSPPRPVTGPTGDYSDQIPRSMKGTPLGSALYDLISKREEKKKELFRLEDAIATIKALGESEVIGNPTVLP